MLISLTQIADRIMHIKQTWKAFKIQTKYSYKLKSAFNLKTTPNKDDKCHTDYLYQTSLRTKALIFKTAM